MTNYINDKVIKEIDIDIYTKKWNFESLEGFVKNKRMREFDKSINTEKEENRVVIGRRNVRILKRK